MTTTLQEAEALYGASDSIKSLASSGELLALHNKVTSLREGSDRSY